MGAPERAREVGLIGISRVEIVVRVWFLLPRAVEPGIGVKCRVLFSSVRHVSRGDDGG